jgi:DNA polymerase V
VLAPENPKYQPVTMDEGSDIRIWGVVTAVVRRFP